jgi:predicted helicase
VNRLMTDGPNLALCSARSVEVSEGWSHILAVDSMIQHHAVSTKEVNHLFPLWGYSEVLGKRSRHHNLSQHAIKRFVDKLGMPFKEGFSRRKKAFGEQDVFEYVLAMLHSAEFRLRYAEPLRDDFARVPITSDFELFSRLRDIGSEIVGPQTTITDETDGFTFPVNGSNTVTATRISVDDKNRIWINNDQYFTGIDEDLWAFSIGGIKVVTQWLSDRRGRVLNTDEIDAYMSLLDSSSRLLDIPGQIDDLIEEHGGWPIA